ncbi:MAG TPA: thymidine kinase [Candidatus Azoamicus sp. MARI]
MTNLYFFYSTMNAGKTTSLLQCNYNYTKMKIKTLLLIPEISNKKGYIISRIGLKKKAKIINKDLNIFKYIKKMKHIKIIFIDEAQFLSKKHIYEIISIVDILNIPVFTYGLRTDFKSHLFDGSKYLLSLADKIIEIKTLCSKCTKKATMNVKVNYGKRILTGRLIEINKNKYLPVCRNHYFTFNKINIY